jgi:D-alanyl-D-alanine carboxypeptidase
MKRLLFGLICIGMPFLTLYGAVSCFTPGRSINPPGAPSAASAPTGERYVDNKGSGGPEIDLSDLERELAIIVDRDQGLHADYEPPDLVLLSENGIRASDPSMRVRQVIIPDLEAMFDAALAQGYSLMVFSAYRSYKTQQKVYNYWVNTLGKEEADRSSARPGHSEHQLGTTMDITVVDLKGNVFDDFGNTSAGRWLAENAYKFGFVMSYPPDTELITGYKHEPWHFRYLGRRLAKIIKERDLIPSQYLRSLAAQGK